MPEFHFNHIYKPVFSTDKRYIDIWGGRGRGGSYFGTDYFLFLITQPNYFRGYFLRQTFNDIKDSLFQDIKDRIEENETLNIEDFKINEANYSLLYVPTGNKIISKGVTGSGKRTAKLKSLAGATHILIEEADEIGEDEFYQMDLSLRTTKSNKIQIIRIFNPPSKHHWIWKSYNLSDIELNIDGKQITYCTAEAKSDSDILSIWSTYEENKINVKESTVKRFEAFKESDPDYYYTIVKGLISDGARGRIYNGWKAITDGYFDSLDASYIYTLDFGYSNDPNALVKIKYEGYDRYYKELLYETGLDNLELAKRLYDLGITESDIIIADTGNGGDLRIAELRRGFRNLEGYPDLRYNIHPTIKGPGSIKFGINRVKSINAHYTESSKNLIHEYHSYKWGMDVNKIPTDNPIDENNHCMDAIRYGELSKGTLY